METKHIIFWAVSLVAIPGGVAAFYLFRRVREGVFFLLVFGSAMPDLFDINFISREWYRGTTRGFEVSFLDILAVVLLLGSVLVRLRGRTRWFWPPSLGAMLLYLLYCGFSVVVSDPALFGMFELLKVVRGIVVFLAVALYVREQRHVHVLLLALGLAVGYETFLALRDRYVFGVHRVRGTLVHPNTFSLYSCIAAPLFAAAAMSGLPWIYRCACGLCVACAGVNVILSISRAGFATLCLSLLGVYAVCASFRLTSKRLAVAALVAIVAAACIYRSWDTLQSRYAESSLREEYAGDVTEGRGVYLRLAKLIVRDRFLGVGLNNWSYFVTNEYAPQIGMFYNPYHGTDRAPDPTVPRGVEAAQAAPAHNIAALTIGELGWPGLVVFALVWARWLQMAATFVRKRPQLLISCFGTGVFFAIGATGLHCLTEWAYRQTPVYFLVHILAGALAAVYYKALKEGDLRSALADAARRIALAAVAVFAHRGHRRA